MFTPIIASATTNVNTCCEKGGNTLKNERIQKYRREKGVYLWEIADGLGRSEMYVNRALRHELSDAERDRWIEIIDQIAQEKGGGADG